MYENVFSYMLKYCIFYVVMTPIMFQLFLNDICIWSRIKKKSFQAIQEILRSDHTQMASLKFLKYAQSSQCRNMNDSSVSYASAALVFE